MLSAYKPTPTFPNLLVNSVYIFAKAAHRRLVLGLEKFFFFHGRELKS